MHPFPGPAAIRSEAYHGLPACQYCGFCTYNGCMADAKGATDVGAIAEAEKTKRLKVMTGARVTKIEVDSHGRATGATFVKGGKTYFQPADVVILSTYIYENTRLLLLSKSKAFPKGLANNSGQVGQHYISHLYGGMNGLFPGKQLNRFSGPGAQRTTIDDFNGDNFDHTGLGFIGGAVIDCRMENKPISAGRTTPPSVPSWGPAWKAWLHQNANSVGSIGTQVEVLAYEDNYCDLDPTVKDAWGQPVLRITFDLHDQEVKRHAYTNDKADQLLKQAGASETWSTGPGVPDRGQQPRLRHDADGQRPRHVGGRQVADGPRGAEPGDPRRVHVPDQHGLQPDAHDRVTGVADGGPHRQALPLDHNVKRQEEMDR